MEMLPIVLIGAIVVILGYLVMTYNTLSTFKVRIRASIQEIGNQLKRQAGLIPNLEASAKGYLKHERGVIKDLADARKAVSQAQKTGSLEDAEKASQKIAGLIPSLNIAVESNPQLKGADVVTQLMDELRDTADKVMYSRRTVIDLTADYNSMLVTFPSNIVANIFGFKEEKGLTVSESGKHTTVSDEELEDPKVNL